MTNNDKIVLLFCFAVTVVFAILGLIYTGYALASWMFA